MNHRRFRCPECGRDTDHGELIKACNLLEMLPDCCMREIAACAAILSGIVTTQKGMRMRRTDKNLLETIAEQAVVCADPEVRKRFSQYRNDAARAKADKLVQFRGQRCSEAERHFHVFTKLSTNDAWTEMPSSIDVVHHADRFEWGRQCDGAMQLSASLLTLHFYAEGMIMVEAKREALRLHAWFCEHVIQHLHPEAFQMDSTQVRKALAGAPKAEAKKQ